ncbi:MAG: hypothetical protein HQL69_15505 [Magnetococcales bacterium]|nr:hypothetical protein [Magnetococcales bacterium]
MKQPDDIFTILASGEVNKRGRTGGTLRYDIGFPTSIGSKELYIRITANNPGGGQFSKSWVKVSALMEAAEEVCDDTGCFQTKSLLGIAGRSANDPGFKIAYLFHSGLVAPCPDNPKRPRIPGEISIQQWTASLTSKVRGKSKSSKATSGNGRQRRGISLDGNEAGKAENIIKNSIPGDTLNVDGVGG